MIIYIFFSFQTGHTAEKKRIPSTSSSEQIQGYLGDGESSTSLSSLHLLDVEGCTERTFEDQQTTQEDSDLNYYNIFYALCYCINLGFIYFIMQWLRAVCWEELTKRNMPFFVAKVAFYFYTDERFSPNNI